MSARRRLVKVRQPWNARGPFWKRSDVLRSVVDFMLHSLRSFSKTWNLLHLSLWVSTLGIPFFSFWIPRQQVSFGRCFAISSALRETKQSEKPRYFYSRNNEYNNKLDYGFLWLLCTIFFNFSNLLKASVDYSCTIIF